MKTNQTMPAFQVSPALAIADSVQFAEYFKDVKNVICLLIKK